MQLHNFLNSGFAFNEEENALAFKFRILNAIMAIAATFALLFALLSDLGINDLGKIHAKVDYLYAFCALLLIVRLRRSPRDFTLVSALFVSISYLTFVSAMVFVVHDEFRLIWFYFVIYVTYVLLGSTAGLVMTGTTLVAIALAAASLDLQLSSSALYTAGLGLLIGSLLSRIYTVQMARYESLLEEKNRALTRSVERLDAALGEAQQASHTKTLFLANMSHEIRTPLNGVLGMAQVLRGTRLDEQQQHYLQTIERAGTTLLHLLDDLLDVTRIEAGKLSLTPRPFDTFAWVIDIRILSEPLFEEGRVAFLSEVSDELPKQLVGDAARLLQVVVNLVGNAAKFTHEGEVRLNVGGQLLNADLYCLRVEVVDSGIGIPAEKLPHIFDAFQQVAPERIINKGVGLGLAISKRLVDAMGGTLRVTSTVGVGSHFVMEVTLPLASDTAGDGMPGPGSEAATALEVLLVDDDAINRLTVGTLLRQAGHQVTEAVNGKVAVEQVSQREFDVVLMDVHMPVMDGVEATRAIRRNGDARVARLPIIGLTASVMSDEQQRYLGAGMDAVAEKPVVMAALMSAIRSATEKRAG